MAPKGRLARSLTLGEGLFLAFLLASLTVVGLILAQNVAHVQVARERAAGAGGAIAVRQATPVTTPPTPGALSR